MYSMHIKMYLKEKNERKKSFIILYIIAQYHNIFTVEKIFAIVKTDKDEST